MSDASKIALELLIERLKHWSDTKFAGAYWAGDKEEEAESQRRLRAGYCHLHQALGTARQALASGDPEQFECAAVHCQALERDGLKLLKRNEEANKRRNGGLRRGEAQTATAKEGYSDHLPQYRKLRAAGKSHSTAVKIIRGGLKDPPSARTLGNWIKKLEGS